MPELVPIRHGRMLASFSFFRRRPGHGLRPVLHPDHWLRGPVLRDAHLSNFGVFGTPEARMLFDVNDFDETVAARGSGREAAVASLAVAGRDRGFTDQERTDDRHRRGRLPDGHAQIRRDVEPGRLVRATGRRRPRHVAGADGQAGEAGRRDHLDQSAEPGPPHCLRQAHHQRREGWSGSETSTPSSRPSTSC